MTVAAVAANLLLPICQITLIRKRNNFSVCLIKAKIVLFIRSRGCLDVNSQCVSDHSDDFLFTNLFVFFHPKIVSFVTELN